MTPPPGHLDFSMAFNREGQAVRRRPAAGKGQLVFVAPYSGALGAERTDSKLKARPLQVDPASSGFRIVAGSIPIDPLTPAGSPFTLPLPDADALHPDRLLRTVPTLKVLWEPLSELYTDGSAATRLNALLADGADTRAAAADDVAERAGGVENDAASATIAGVVPAAQPTAEPENDLLGRLLGDRPVHADSSSSAAKGATGTSAERLVQQLAASAVGQAHVVRHSAASDQGDLRARAELELGRRLRALLRQEDFRRVAASWYATEMVVRACPDDTLARFSAVDASWQQLVAEPSGLKALLGEGTSVLVVDHCFGATAEELRALVCLVRACSEQGVFLVTGALPSLAACSGPAQAGLEEPGQIQDGWQADWDTEALEAWAELGPLREAGAQFALALPRCLIRQPYGKRGEPLDKLEFEELGDRPGVEDFLWANGAYLVAQALMEQWCGGQPQRDGTYDLSGLPVVTVSDGDGRRLQPPLEMVLSSSTVEQLLDQGFSVIEAIINTDRARVHV